MDKKTDYLVLVNKENKLPNDWNKTVELVKVIDVRGDEILAEENTLEAYKKLKEEIIKTGIIIEIDSIYRSIDEQQELWDEYMEKCGEEYVRKYIAVPGYSEHHTGLAVDICVVENGVVMSDDDMIEDKNNIFSDIHQKISKYGFILRYPKGKEEITGYAYEPWHFRYVGESIAEEIYQKKLTFEEYKKKAII